MRVLLIAIAILSVGCGARVPVAQAYGECEADEDCDDAARCATSMFFSVCQPACAEDEDCPLVEGATAYCGDQGEHAGQCVIGPEGRSCPTGMVMVGSTPSPASPLICAWES